MKIRSVAAAGLWCATVVVVLFAGMRHFSASRVPAPFPQTGQAMDVQAIETNFGIDLPEGRSAWLLVVTSSCKRCGQPVDLQFMAADTDVLTRGRHPVRTA